jgi:hypothetical protein
MPISIAGSGTITGISVGGIPDGVVDTDVLAANAVTTAKLGSAEASGLAKAWVNFNASSGTPSIRSSYNLSSITDEGVGKFTLNFSSSLTDANYSVVTSSGNTGSDSSTGLIGASMSSTTAYQNKTSSAVYIGILAANNAAFLDHFDINVAIFR